MSYYLNKYNVAIDGEGYVLSRNRNASHYYQKRKAPTFVNKFGSGDSSYRDGSFWQYWASTNWRNGSKQLLLDDPGKFWKSENINVTELNEITLSRKLTLVGQIATGVKVNTISAWRNSQSWANASYGYRQQITVTAPSGQQVPSGHPVKITIDTAALQTASKVRSDRNDWRVFYFNGSSWVDLTRDYVTTTSTFFALQAAIPAGQSDSNYYVYYGNSGESTSKQPSTEAEWNSVYGFFGTTPDANSVAIYHFREGSGTTVNDDTTNSNTGTMNTASWATDGKFGRVGVFNGSSQHVNIGSGINLGSMTLEGWFYFDNVSGDIKQIINRRSSLGVGFQLMQQTGKIKYTIRDSGGETTLTSSATLSASAWYHIAATHDGSTMRIYINGTLDSSQAIGVTIAQTGDAIIGAQADGSLGQRLAGRAHHMRVSNTARTSFPYVLSSEPSLNYGSELTTQPPSSSFDTYVGGSDGKLYKHDGVSSFVEQFDMRRIVWHDTNDDNASGVGFEASNEVKIGQSFTVPANSRVRAVSLKILRNTSIQGYTARIETETSSLPSGTLVDSNATATVANADIPVSAGWVTFEFPASITLNSGTNYWIVLQCANIGSETGFAQWRRDESSPTYANGIGASKTGASAWSSASGIDHMFRILGNQTSINTALVTSVGGTLKLLLGTGSVSSQDNSDARIYSFDGTNYSLEKTFATTTESQVLKLEEYNSKLYATVGPQAKVYEGTSTSSWTISKDIDVPQKPGYPYALKEYNQRLYAGGGSPEFLYDKHYNGFWYVFDGTNWDPLYPFDFTEIRAFEFYDGFLFGCTYHGHIYVFDTASLNPLFNFKNGYNYNVSILDAKLFDDKIYFLLYPQEATNETNVGIWVFDRHGLSLAHKLSGVTGYRCAAVVNNSLLIGTGDDGNVYRLDLTNYVTQGWLQTSYFDAGLASIDKLYNSISLNHDPLQNGQSIVVYYKFKESDDWTTLGTSSTVGSTTSTITFPSATFSKKISLKIEVNTSDTSITPKVTEYVLQYALYPQRKWLWTMRIRAKKNLVLYDKTTESRTATQIRQDIEDANNAYKLVTFVDIDGASYNVLFHELDQSSWVVNQSDVNEDEIAITLLEA